MNRMMSNDPLMPWVDYPYAESDMYKKQITRVEEFTTDVFSKEIEVNSVQDDKQIQQQENQSRSAPDMHIPRKLWSTEHYRTLAALTREGLTGKQLMERCNIGRRDTMKAMLQDAQDAGHGCGRVQWSEEAAGNSRNPRQLKADKSGNLHISNKRFAFHGINVSEGDRFTFVCRDGAFILTLVEKRT